MAEETSLNANVSMGNYGTSAAGGSIESNGYYDYIKAGYGNILRNNIRKYKSPLINVSRQLSTYDAQKITESSLYPYDNFDINDISDPKDGYQSSKMLGAGLSMQEDNAYRSVFSNMGLDYHEDYPNG